MDSTIDVYQPSILPLSFTHLVRFHNPPNVDNGDYRGTPSTSLSPLLTLSPNIPRSSRTHLLILRIHVLLRAALPLSSNLPFRFRASFPAAPAIGFSGTTFTNSHAQPRLTAAKSKFLSFRQSIVPVCVCMCVCVSERAHFR